MREVYAHLAAHAAATARWAWSRRSAPTCRIFYKYEGGRPAGSHKPNTAVPAGVLQPQEGVTRLATETGAGQWGSALAFACQLFGLECKVYMVRVVLRREALPPLA